jgi:hypothetical protein
LTLERIEVTPFVLVAGEILQQRRTGQLTVTKPPLRRVLYWAQGELVFSVATNQEDSLGEFLLKKRAITPEQATQLSNDAMMVAARVHESGLLDLSKRQALLREWLAGHFIPLFSLDSGTCAFAEEEALPPEQRIFLASTAALIVEGVRSISNGLVLRNCLGSLGRVIEIDRDSRYPIERLPLSDEERAIASSLDEPMSIEDFLKRHHEVSMTVARIVIAMMALGTYTTVRERRMAAAPDAAFLQRDMEILATIGSGDQRSLRALGLSKQLVSLDHYQVLDVPRAASRSQIVMSAERMKGVYDPSTYPPILRDALNTIHRRIDEALEQLKDPARRSAYDKALHSGSRDASMQQRVMRSTIAEQNYLKAKELAVHGDYYGAIVLLKQALNFVPDDAKAWHLLGSCQEHNPKWRRDAAESYQKALSLDPNNAEVLVSLGDLYRHEGMSTRAQTCYEDALKINPDSEQAARRLTAMKKS